MQKHPGADASGEYADRCSALLVCIAEAYPELKANANFMQLQAEITDTESKIALPPILS